MPSEKCLLKTKILDNPGMGKLKKNKFVSKLQGLKDNSV